MNRLSYRLNQFLSALRPHILDEERKLLALELSLAERSLFERMPAFDQRHALDVYATLLCAGERDEVLLKAALLHDCGKVDDQGRSIPLLYYGIFVILAKFAPGLYQRAVHDGRGLLWPFAIHHTHGLRSARLVEQANSSAALVTLLRDYAAGQQTDATRALARADDMC